MNNYEFVYDPDRHAYYIDGEKIPGVTSLVSPLGPEFDPADEYMEGTLENARERGSTLHAYLEHRLRGGDPEDFELPEAYDGFVEAIEEFLFEHTFAPALTETPMWGYLSGVRFGGTPDYIGDFDGELAILDYKFVSQLAKTRVAAQLNGYMSVALCNEIFPEKMYAVQFLPTGTYRLYEVKDDATDFELCLSVYKAKTKKHPRGGIA